MYSLFPKHRPRLIFNLSIFWAMLIALLLINPAINRTFVLILAVVGSAAIFFAQYMRVANLHTAMLSRLYNQLDVEGFLKEYEPFLQVPLKNQNLYLMVRLHVSNAYCAQGRFDDAIALLSSVTYREDKEEKLLLGKFSVTSNLCYCYEQKGDKEQSRRYLNELRELKAKLDALQQKKPEKQRMVFNIALNEQCMQFLETGEMDVDVLKTQVQAANTQQLHRVTTSLWIARAYLARHERREAEKLLERIVTLAPGIYPGRAAKALLDELPGRDAGAEEAPSGETPAQATLDAPREDGEPAPSAPRAPEDKK